MNLPIGPFRDFISRADSITFRARRNSKKLAKLEQYYEIEDDLMSKLPNAKVHFYGSRPMGLATFHSDLDIFIETNSFEGASRAHSRNLMGRLKNKMNADQNWDVNVVIYDATVPVMRCFYRPKQLRCDIQFSNGLAVFNSDVAHHLFSIQSEAIKFYHAIRIWLEIAGVKMKSYQLTILVIFFLQNENLMPSIVNVQRGMKTTTVDRWNIQFDDKRIIQQYGCDRMNYYMDYLADFFWFYSGFNFDQDIVFPYYGYAVLKQNYPQQAQLKRFCSNRRLFRMDGPMVLTSLLSFDYNVAYDIGRHRLWDFIDTCEMSYDLLNNNV